MKYIEQFCDFLIFDVVNYFLDFGFAFRCVTMV